MTYHAWAKLTGSEQRRDRSRTLLEGARLAVLGEEGEHGEGVG